MLNSHWSSHTIENSTFLALSVDLATLSSNQGKKFYYFPHKYQGKGQQAPTLITEFSDGVEFS